MELYLKSTTFEIFFSRNYIYCIKFYHGKTKHTSDTLYVCSSGNRNLKFAWGIHGKEELKWHKKINIEFKITIFQPNQFLKIDWHNQNPKDTISLIFILRYSMFSSKSRFFKSCFNNFLVTHYMFTYIVSQTTHKTLKMSSFIILVLTTRVQPINDFYHSRTFT